MPGQINDIEARMLRGAVIEYKPMMCVEVGTRHGDGTTKVIADALPRDARLWTIEKDPECVAIACRNVRHNTTVVEGDSVTVLATLMPYLIGIDFLMLDGGDGIAPAAELSLCEPFMAPGSILCVHDWLLEKTAYLRQYLDNWEVVVETPKLAERGEDALIPAQGMVIEFPGLAILRRK